MTGPVTDTMVEAGAAALAMSLDDEVWENIPWHWKEPYLKGTKAALEAAIAAMEQAAAPPAPPAEAPLPVTFDTLAPRQKIIAETLFYTVAGGADDTLMDMAASIACTQAVAVERALVEAGALPEHAPAAGYERHMDQLDAANAGNRWLEPIVEDLPMIAHEHMTVERSDFAVHVYWRNEHPYAGFLVFRDSANFSILKTIRFGEPEHAPAVDLGAGLREAIGIVAGQRNKWCENHLYSEVNSADDILELLEKAALAAERNGGAG